MADTRDQIVSPKHALTPREIKFCKVFAAFGFEQQAEAYRRVYYPEIEDEEGEWRDHPGLPEAPIVSSRVQKVLAKAHIQSYLAALKERPTDVAHNTLAEMLHFGGESDRRAAAKLIFEQEDKLGARDAGLIYQDVMVDCEAEVVIELGEGHVCQSCGHPQEIAFPLALMFPEAGNRALDEQTEALQKTCRALEGLVEKQREEIAELRGETPEQQEDD